MQTKIIQATQRAEFNWGKFLVGKFFEEWTVAAAFPEGETRSMMSLRGWHEHQYLVLDMETKEGAVFGLNGMAKADLRDKHKIWVCPMYEPFLEWLNLNYRAYWAEHGGVKAYKYWIDTLPDRVVLNTDVGDIAGYRRGNG